ncbi:CAP domain-containing protein (plasmid) [Streptomyces sp. NBC_01717]|uniref:CAP domain-containing protein n=1 Tax=Streptomyces sp. NBC_01717 TaxID=2975918 RepID=UPI002E31A7DA|nr:CAP domain-containing protein [Streptomyces sp. NBC_01717]
MGIVSRKRASRMKPGRSDGIEEYEEEGWDAQWETDRGSRLRFRQAADERIGPALRNASRSFIRTRREGLEDSVVTLVNQERTARGLSTLHIDERLRNSSRAHSEDMAARGFIDHLSPEGISPLERMLMAGYPFPAAENVAVFLPEPMGVMRGWMNSPGHRLNVLNPAFRAIGVGIHVEAGTAWWTQNFGYW